MLEFTRTGGLPALRPSADPAAARARARARVLREGRRARLLHSLYSAGAVAEEGEEEEEEADKEKKRSARKLILALIEATRRRRRRRMGTEEPSGMRGVVGGELLTS